MQKSSAGFVRRMLSLAIPVTLQNLLFSSFTLVDTLMIGRLGDTPLAAVGMAGKWSWFFSIVLFGCTSGAGVFIAQYFGAQDRRGIHRTYGLMSLLTLGASVIFTLAALLAPQAIVSLFTRDPQAIELGSAYLRIIGLSYPMQALSKSGGTLLQSTQRVVIPFVGAACSVCTNVALNAVLIFGLFGFPALGVQGAAIASVIAAVVNTAVIYIAGIRTNSMLRAPLQDMFAMDRGFVRDYVRICAPAMFNETTWALSNLIYSAIFGHMSTEAYAAITVVKSIEELSCVAVFGLGASCAVMIGSMIGRGDVPQAKRCAWAHLKLVTALSMVVGACIFLLRGQIMSLFGVSDAVRTGAAALLAIYGFAMWIRNIPYMLVVGIFRAGGDTKYAVYVDMGAAYLVGIPLTALCGLVLHLPLSVVYGLMLLVEDTLKVFIYGRHFLSDRWIRPIISTNKEVPDATDGNEKA